MEALEFEELGLIAYGDALEIQQKYFDAALHLKQSGCQVHNRWLFCQHLPVITIGKHGKRSNLLFSEEELFKKGVDLVSTQRGGDVTFHGPGQLIAYPILDLEHYRMGLREYIHFLEEIVIRTIAEYGIIGERIEGASGVWLGKGTSAERKICAIGVKSSRYLTMHGLALNVNTNLSYFSLIHPCGFINKGVTSLEKETGEITDLKIVSDQMRKHVLQLLECDIFS